MTTRTPIPTAAWLRSGAVDSAAALKHGGSLFYHPARQGYGDDDSFLAVARRLRHGTDLTAVARWLLALHYVPGHDSTDGKPHVFDARNPIGRFDVGEWFVLPLREGIGCGTLPRTYGDAYFLKEFRRVAVDGTYSTGTEPAQLTVNITADTRQVRDSLQSFAAELVRASDTLGIPVADAIRESAGGVDNAPAAAQVYSDVYNPDQRVRALYIGDNDGAIDAAAAWLGQQVQSRRSAMSAARVAPGRNVRSVLIPEKLAAGGNVQESARRVEAGCHLVRNSDGRFSIMPGGDGRFSAVYALYYPPKMTYPNGGGMHSVQMHAHFGGGGPIMVADVVGPCEWYAKGQHADWVYRCTLGADDVLTMVPVLREHMGKH